MRKNSLQGFSLIELLVVITILAILSAIGIAAFRNVADNARDAKRKADVDAIVKALENQFNPETGTYPASLQSAFFTSNSIPQKPEGGSYNVELNEDKTGFQICVTLEKDSSSYCKQSSQGKFIVVTPPDTDSGVDESPIVPPAPFSDYYKSQMSGSCVDGSMSVAWPNFASSTSHYALQFFDITSGTKVDYKWFDNIAPTGTSSTLQSYSTVGTPDRTYSWRVLEMDNSSGKPLYALGFNGPDIACTGALPEPIAPVVPVCEAGDAKIIFATKTKYKGDLGGLTGADTICQSAADAVGLTGTYKAWLSDSTTNAADRLCHSAVPYQLPNGTKVADDWAGLTSGTLLAPINKTGDSSTIYSFVPDNMWTNTNTNGIKSSSSTCDNWTSASSSFNGAYGGVYSSAAWTIRLVSGYANAVSCSNSNHLYCLQQ